MLDKEIEVLDGLNDHKNKIIFAMGLLQLTIIVAKLCGLIACDWDMVIIPTITIALVIPYLALLLLLQLSFSTLDETKGEIVATIIWLATVVHVLTHIIS